MGTIGFNTSGQFQVGGHAVKYGQNYIINGGFDYWNYATNQTTSGYGSDDRWVNANTGSTKSHIQQPTGDLASALFSASKISETVVTSVVGVNNYVIKSQAVENVTKLAGKTVTISFWAKADTNRNIAIELQQHFGTGGTPSTSVTAIGSQLIALTATWQKKSITITIPSILGKTLGTDGVHTSATWLGFWFDAGSNWNARTANLGQQSGTFDIAEVKLEEGSVATPWTPYEGEFGGEVQACQRYYEKGTIYWDGLSTVGSNYSCMVYYKSQKRVIPTVILTNASVLSMNATPNISANQLDNISVYHAASATAAGNFRDTYTASAEL